MNQLSFLSPVPSERYRPKVRDLPVRERPINRLREVGPQAVSTAEILACLLQTPKALDQATQMLVEFGGLPGIARATDAELAEIDGIGPAQAARIKAALECGRRLTTAAPHIRYAIRAPGDVAQLLVSEIGTKDREHFIVLVLDTRNQVLHKETLYIGTLNSSHVRVADVFQVALRRNAAGIVVAHNHPSGDPSPSPEDVSVTRELVAAGKLLDIEMLDHLIIGDSRWVSLRERGLGFD